METRKVQRVGYSTLAVSLPKNWAKEKGLKPGDTVTIEKGEDGSLKIYPGLRRGGERKLTKCLIFSDSCKKPRLVTRILTGCYITGHDTINVVSRRELKPEHLEEIRESVKRLSGIGIVEQTMKNVVIQCFIDPSKFPVYSLFKRVHSIISTMLEAVMKAFIQHRPGLLNEVFHMEDEIDQIYWLIIRQLLISLHNDEVRRDIGIKSIDHIVGNRTIAKNLELIADNIEKMAKATLTLESQKHEYDKELVKEILDFSKSVKFVLDKTMEALFRMDIELASEAIDAADLIEKISPGVSEKIIGKEKTAKAIVNLEIIRSSLEQIAYLCNVIAEIVINRILEKSSDVCRLEVVEK